MFAGFSVKVGIVFSRFRLSPNQWTLLSLVPIVAAFYYLVTEDFLIAALFFFISSFIDLIDGSVARVTGRVTRLGAYLDTVIDRYVEGIIIIGLLFASLPEFYIPAYAWIFIYFFGSMMTTYVKAAAKEKELTDKEIKGGIIERAERLIILFIGILLANFDKFYLVYVIMILAILTNISALQRIRIAFKSGRKEKS